MKLVTRRSSAHQMTQCHPGIAVQNRKTVSQTREQRPDLGDDELGPALVDMPRGLSQNRRFFVVAEDAYSSLEFPSAPSFSTSALMFSVI